MDARVREPSDMDLVIRLIESGSLFVQRGELFEKEPAEVWAAHDAAAVDWDRVEGMMLGLAIGDSLGNTTEALNPDRRRRWFPEDIRDYIPFEIETPNGPSLESALPSDDTQLAFWTLEQLLDDDGRVVPEHLLDRFCSRRIEPPRLSWRLQPLRGWSHEQIDEIPKGSTGPCRTPGLRARARVQLAVGRDHLDRIKARHDGRDAAQVGPSR
jgi:hypothetical protein